MRKQDTARAIKCFISGAQRPVIKACDLLPTLIMRPNSSTGVSPAPAHGGIGCSGSGCHGTGSAGSLRAQSAE